MGPFRRSWWLAALLCTSACNLNPRPEDPGVNGSNGFNGDTAGKGSGGGASTPPSSPGKHTADAGALTPPTGDSTGERRREAGSVLPDAGPADGGVEAGSAMPDGPVR